jgi:hypothetical protein
MPGIHVLGAEEDVDGRTSPAMTNVVAAQTRSLRPGANIDDIE